MNEGYTTIKVLDSIIKEQDKRIQRLALHIVNCQDLIVDINRMLTELNKRVDILWNYKKDK